MFKGTCYVFIYHVKMYMFRKHTCIKFRFSSSYLY